MRPRVGVSVGFRLCRHLIFRNLRCAAQEINLYAVRLMTMTVRCASCGRKDGNCALGISVNAIGCTGACLHWALHATDNLPFWYSNQGWDNWEVSDEDATCIELICSDVNPQGCAMLTYVHCDATVDASMYLVDWIDFLRVRYEYFLALAEPHLIDVYCFRLPRLYTLIRKLNRQLADQLTLINTLKVAVCDDETLQVNTSAMSGNTICEEKSYDCNDW